MGPLPASALHCGMSRLRNSNWSWRASASSAAIPCGSASNPTRRLLGLQNAVESVLQRIAPVAGPRPYQPHIKLAHSQRRRSFRRFLAEHAGFRAEPFEVGAFSLMESRPGEGGVVYEHRADYVLDPALRLPLTWINEGDRAPGLDWQQSRGGSA